MSCGEVSSGMPVDSICARRKEVDKECVHHAYEIHAMLERDNYNQLFRTKSDDRTMQNRFINMFDCLRRML